jgi:3-phosphoshikimate 1-carboxyvinyltransferase
VTATHVHPATRPVRGSATLPGDKSISHRAALVAGIARGTSTIRGYSAAGDCRSTLAALEALDVGVIRAPEAVTVEGRGGRGLEPPGEAIDCGRSGTTMRLLAGILAGHPGTFVLTGHEQLLGRPMERVAAPLRLMGARVRTGEAGRPPLRIAGGRLAGIEYRLPVASAQVKSAVLLAGLFASGSTSVEEAIPTRDHTERVLEAAGIRVTRSSVGSGANVRVEPDTPEAFDLAVPGDLSSAAALITGATLVPGSDLRLPDVGLNPTRTGFLEVLARMGGSVDVERMDDGPEPRGDLRIRHAALGATRIGPDEVPSVIDELPLIGLLGTQAEGTTEVRGAEELRVKESDRIAGLVGGLRALGADVGELPDGFVVRGPTALSGGSCDARWDHRLAIAFALAGLIASDPVSVDGMDFVGDSFPEFVRTLDALR